MKVFERFSAEKRALRKIRRFLREVGIDDSKMTDAEIVERVMAFCTKMSKVVGMTAEEAAKALDYVGRVMKMGGES